jgi:hypothetical protein
MMNVAGILIRGLHFTGYILGKKELSLFLKRVLEHPGREILRGSIFDVQSLDVPQKEEPPISEKLTETHCKLSDRQWRMQT